MLETPNIESLDKYNRKLCLLEERLMKIDIEILIIKRQNLVDEILSKAIPACSRLGDNGGNPPY